MKKRRKKKVKIVRILAYTIAIIYALLTLFPFAWSLITSLKETKDTLYFTIPLDRLSFDNYVFLLTDPNLMFMRWLWNSVVVAAVSTTCCMLFNSMCGYALARIRFTGSQACFFIILAVMMIPSQIMLIPQFMLVSDLKLVNTLGGIMCVKLTDSFGIFLMRQFFLSLPKELEEAAKIDGLGRFGIFFKIAVPLALPALATQFVFMFNGSWNNLLWPSVVARTNEMFTLPVGLNSFYGQYFQFWDQVMAGVMILTLPSIIVYIIFQKYLVKGVATTGLKG